MSKQTVMIGAKEFPVRTVKHQREALGAICGDCGMVWSQIDYPWHFSKSRALHQRGTGHRVSYFTVDPPSAEAA